MWSSVPDRMKDYSQVFETENLLNLVVIYAAEMILGPIGKSHDFNFLIFEFQAVFLAILG